MILSSEEVGKAIEKEYEQAITKPKFHSDHEAYAVLLEEVEEAEAELNAIKNQLEIMWRGVKRNEKPFTEIRNIRTRAGLLCSESAQIAAVCWKWLKGEGKNET